MRDRRFAATKSADVRLWHLASLAAFLRFGRYWANSGQSGPPTNKPRSALFNLADDRALPAHARAFPRETA